MAVRELNNTLAQATQLDPAIVLYFLGNSLNNLTTEEMTEQLIEVKFYMRFAYC